MLDRFRQYNNQQHLVPDGAEVLLAVSGGRDSVAMADLASRTGLRFAIAHCNFNLRPGDCDRDQHFVMQLAEGYGVPFFTTSFDTRAYAVEKGLSVEEAARELRYSWFARLCRDNDYACVATAHHRDDSVETFFLNLFRGTGIAGLHGIRPRSELAVGGLSMTVVRPMLCFSRADIDAYIAVRGLAYVEDHTNAELDARRNRIRHQLMPLLRELYPSVDTTMQANIERLSEAGQVFAGRVAELRQRLVKVYTPQLSTMPMTIEAIAVDDISALSPQRTLLFELLRPYGFNAATVDDMLQAIADGHSGRLFLSPTHQAELHRGQLLLAPNAVPREPRLAVDNDAAVPSSFAGIDPSCTLWVDAEAVKGGLKLRRWQEGDRFRPFGMKGTRLVSDFLKDSGLSLIERGHVFLLTDSTDTPLWLVGLRADDRFRITEATRKALRVDLAD